MLHVFKNVLSLSRDLMVTVKPEYILSGKRLFRPFRKFQNAWMDFIYPGEVIRDDISVWSYLQTYMMPVIQRNASSWHLQGIRKLQLDQPLQPDFCEFQRRFHEVSRGFHIEPVMDEIAPREYFKLISQKRFPCIEKMRAHHELFCGNEPDFWHEAIGHIAPLCDPAVQEFYLQIADYMLSASSIPKFDRQLAVAWTLMEYGFIKEDGKDKMFGAALVGSHLANMRYQRGLISVEPADRHDIIDSGFFAEDKPTPRDDQGRIRFFCMDKLDAEPYFL